MKIPPAVTKILSPFKKGKGRGREDLKSDIQSNWVWHIPSLDMLAILAENWIKQNVSRDIPTGLKLELRTILMVVTCISNVFMGSGENTKTYGFQIFSY